VHPALRDLAHRQLGLFTAADARRAGYGQPEIRHLCSSGRWVRLRRGVYVTSDDLAAIEHRGSRHRTECLAVLLALDRSSAALSHTSAARLWGLPVLRGSDPTVRLTDPAQWRRGQGYLMSCAPLPAGDVATTGPFRLTTPTRTLVDCAREWALEDAVVAIDAALLHGRCTLEELRRATDGMHHWPGIPRAVRAVSLADGRAESPLETRGRLRIVGSGFPTPELQVEIRTDGRLLGVVDGWYDDAAVAIEFDGRVKYRDPWRERTAEQVLWEEKHREDEMLALAIRVLRITDDDLGGRWPRVAAHLGRLLAEPGPEVRAFTAVPRTRGVARTGR